MCIPSLTIEQLETLKTYKYESTNKSIAFNYIIGPILNQCAKFLPCSIPPLLLNFLALVFNIIPLIIINNQVFNDFSENLEKHICIIFAIFHFLYIIVDNYNSVQSKYPGYTPYHMLVGHWCNVFIIIILSYNLSHLFQTGNEGPFSVMFFIGLMLGYYASAYEEFALGELHLSYFNAANEGNLLIVFFALIGGIFGSKRFTYEIWDLTVGEWIGLFTLIASVHIAIMSLINIYFGKGMKRVLSTLVDWFCFYNVFIVPFVMSEKDDVLLYDNFWLIMLSICLLFARNATDLQVKIFTKQPSSLGIMVIVLNALMPISFFIRKKKIILSIYTICSIGFATEMGMLFVIRSIEIMTYLKTNFLCIPKTQVESPC